MALHLLGGVARGFTVEVPPADHIRPTSVMLRRKLFDANQDMSDAIFVDLCAGSGAVGLEAWSRGAKQVHLVEFDAKTYKVLGLNTKKISERFDQEARARIISIKREKAQKWLEEFKSRYSSWSKDDQAQTVLFIDPPYEKKDLYTSLVDAEMKQWFFGRVWIESDRQKGLPSEFWENWGEQFVKCYFQGTSYVAVLDLRESLG